MTKSNNLIRRTTNGLAPNIIRGGNAIDLGNDLFFVQGRSHNNGGVDVGNNLEVEGGEIIKVDKDNVKVFSARPFLGGYSPSQLVLAGNNPETVFALQEKYKPKDNNDNKAGFGDFIKNVINKIKGNKNNNDNDELSQKELDRQNEEYLIKNNLTRDILGEELFNYYTGNNDTVYVFNATDENGERHYGSNRIESNKLTRTGYNTLKGKINEPGNKIYTIDENGNYKEENDSILEQIRPRLDYIQGGYDTVPIIDPEDYILKVSNEYGVDPNIVVRRFLKEGSVNSTLNEYNDFSTKEQQKELRKNGLNYYNRTFSIFGDLGLDSFMELFKNKNENNKIKIKNKELEEKLNKLTTHSMTNEKGLNVETGSVTGRDAIEMYAAFVKYLTDKVNNDERYKDYNKAALINAMFNMGIYHSDLKNKKYIESNYAVPDYYGTRNQSKQTKEQKVMKNGGLSPLSKNQLIVYTPFSTGKKKGANTININHGNKDKAELGLLEWNAIGQGATSLLGNLVSGIGSSVVGNRLKKLYNNLTRTSTYVPVAREHINTTVDVNPQLDAVRNAQAQANRMIDVNTNSSKAAINRKRSVALNSLAQGNTIYGDKLNRETQLRNAEAQLQTQYNMVDNANKIKDIEAQNDFEMQRRIGLANADNAITNGWMSAAQNVLGDSANIFNNMLSGYLSLAGSQNKELADIGISGLQRFGLGSIEPDIDIDGNLTIRNPRRYRRFVRNN